MDTGAESEVVETPPEPDDDVVEPTPSDGVQRYEVKIVATGEVHDAAGNLVSQGPVEATAILTEDEVLEQIARMERERVPE